MDNQDWNPVIFRKPMNSKTSENNQPSSLNKLSDEAIRLNQLDNDNLELTHVTLGLQHVIQQSRTKLGLTQAQLAQKLNVKSSVINEYENGKAVPNNQFLGKMERVLSVRLRGKNMGKSLT